ncbi:MAG: PAS domain S-box protein [Methanoregula sp.]|nr:PAS domain S-box protein [Methanoregula sp.]
MALKREITAKIKELLRERPQGLSITEIVRIININRNTAGRYLENLMVSGQVEMRHFGMAKIYRLAQRVPLSAMLSISSELIMLLDGSLRVLYANEPLLKFLETTQNDLYGKNIEYTPCVSVFDDAFDTLKKNMKGGLAGKEWSGELSLKNKEIVFSCRIAPTVFEEGQRGVSVLLEDITEWKRSEQRIQESERQFRLLAENTLDMIDRHMPDGTCIYVSPACKTTMGYDPEELIGHTAFEVLHPDDVHIIAKYQSELSRKTPSARVTYRVRHKDGHYVWVESVIRAIFDDKTGEFIEIYGVTRDISRRKKAEDALRESEDRYRKLVEISPDAVILHRDGKIIYLNPTALNLLGALDPNEIIGNNVLDYIQPDFRDAVRINIEKDLGGDITPPMELHMVRVDGKPIDITERKRTEKELRESEVTSRALINAPTDSVLLLDSKGIILDINETAARRFGKPKDGLIGIRADDVLPEEIAKARRSIINQVIEKKSAIRFEDERHGVWFDTVTYPIMSETGEVNKIAIIARDITNRRRIEEALRKSEEKLHAMLQSITDPMNMMDEDLNIIWVNETAKQYFGKDIVGRKCYEAFHQRQTPCEPYSCLALKAFRDGKMHRHETAMIDAHGQTRFFECTTNVALRDKSGKPVAVLEISRDITDRKRAEEALRER